MGARRATGVRAARRQRMTRGSFFFSSRIRHTRSYGDWSTDVCSSDLAGSRLNIVLIDAAQLAAGMSDPLRRPTRAGTDYLLAPIPHVGAFHPKIVALLSEKQPLRSEERRVGKE